MADGRKKANKNPEKRKNSIKSQEKSGKPHGPLSRYVSMKIAQKLDIIAGWVANGATHTEIAKTFEVSSAIISQWKTQYPEFRHAMDSNKPQAVGRLISRAFDMAAGYERSEKRIFKMRREWHEEVAGKSCKFFEDFLEEREVAVYYPPNPKMTEFLLVNWDPEHFKRINDVAPESGKKLEDFFDSVEPREDDANDITTISAKETGPLESIKQ